MIWQTDILSHDEAQTIEIGRTIGRELAAGDVVGLVGELGAGKTRLAKGLAAGLGVADGRTVSSPTFVLVNEYDGRLHVYHVDAYRLGCPRELAALGFDEMCESGGVVLIEWADRVRTLLGPAALWIDIQAVGESDRRLTLRSENEGLANRLRSCYNT